MSQLFINLFNLSVSATWLIAAVIIIRLALKKFAPRWTVCLLWAVVGLRLIIPFSIESELSLIPSVQTLNPDAIYTSESVSDFVSEDISETVSTEDISEDRADNSANEPIIIPPIANIDKPDPEVSSGVTDQPQATPDKNTPENKIPDVVPDKDYIQSGIKPVDDRLNGAISSAVAENPKKNPIKTFTNVGCIVWIVGMAVMGIYAAVNYLLLKRRVSESVPEENNVRRSENVGSPFILGIIKPKIYLPFGLSSETEHHIIAHERAHIKRLDHLIKPFGYMLLTVYWFNPLVWIAYILLCRDIETACDEKVVEKMNAEARKAYASALLECGIKRSVIAACPVAFGEIGVKQRVKNALTYKKPMLWIIIAAIILCVAVAVFFLTGPSDNDTDASSNSSDATVESSDVASDAETDSSEVSDESNEIGDNPSIPTSIPFTQYIFDGSVSEMLDSNVLADYLIAFDKEDLDYLISQCNSEKMFDEFDGSINDFADSLDEDFFNEKAIIAVPVSGSAQITRFSIDSIVRSGENEITLTVLRDESNAMDTAIQHNILVAVVSKSDIEGCRAFLANEISADIVHFSGKVSVTDSSDNRINITDSSAKQILSLLNKGKWKDEIAESVGTHIITVGEDKLTYVSMSGLIIDTARGRTLTLTDEENTRISAAVKDEEKEEPVLGPGMPIQSTHQTPEEFTSSGFMTSITYLKVKLFDSEKVLKRYSDQHSQIVQKGLKVWICDMDGNKIDYVYTNSKGIARFEVMKGNYRFYFEGNSQYASKYAYGSLKADATNINGAWITNGPYGNDTIKIFAYPKQYTDYKYYITEKGTGAPIANAKVTITLIDDKTTTVYTDKNGMAVSDALITDYYGWGFSRKITVTSPNHNTVSEKATILDGEIHLEMDKTTYCDFSLEMVDEDGNPISGVTAEKSEGTNKEWDDRSYFKSATSGNDGIISGVVSSETTSHHFAAIVLTYSKNCVENGVTVKKTGSYELEISGLYKETKKNIVVTVTETEDGFEFTAHW